MRRFINAFLSPFDTSRARFRRRIHSITADLITNLLALYYFHRQYDYLSRIDGYKPTAHIPLLGDMLYKRPLI
jgi:hypothetical protein